MECVEKVIFSWGVAPNPTKKLARSRTTVACLTAKPPMLQPSALTRALKKVPKNLKNFVINALCAFVRRSF